MKPATRLLLTALTHPQTVEGCTPGDLDLLLRVARAASLEALLYHRLEAHGLPAALPRRPRRHLEAAATVAARQRTQVQWEVEQIRRALHPRGIPVVLLKGAAYTVAELPAAEGRLFSDVDILVPRAALAEAERLLFAHGWIAEGYDAYDQAYYRRWMHELPALTHIRRKSVLDLHHTILPPTARARPDAGKLLAAAVPLPGRPGLSVLAPADMVLHSAAHRFHDGEMGHGLRDVVDMDALLRHFGRHPGFWPTLVARAFSLDLARPLYYGLRYAQRMLESPVPPAVIDALADAAPSRYLQAAMDLLFEHGLAPHHWCCDDRLSPLARQLLYLRAHYLRMPLHLLLPHLLRKAVKRRAQGSRAAATETRA